MGLLNAAHGRLVDLVGRALDEDLWQGWGIHSPAAWLAWQAGMSPSRNKRPPPAGRNEQPGRPPPQPTPEPDDHAG